MIEMVMSVIAARIMPDPMAIVVDMWSIGVTRSVPEVPIWFHTRRSVEGFRAVHGSRMLPSTRMAAAGVLRPRWEKKKHCRK
jgi:hypothetical protein